MSYAASHGIALVGAHGQLVDVQVDVSQGQVATVMVGRLDGALTEARDRVKMAVNNSALEAADHWPSTRRVTILLAPADLPKGGTHFDLAIAAALLAAIGRVSPEALAGTVMIGELALSGALRPVTGVLPMAMAAAQAGIRRVFVPEPQAREAAMVPGLTVFGMRSLSQVVAELRGEEVPEAPPVVDAGATRVLQWRSQEVRADADFLDLVGVADEKYAVEVAAAGGHHVMLSGPRGSGKTSLAERIPSIMPPLDTEQALELAAVHSLSGTLDPGASLPTRPPFFGPHHDASKASLLGGGTGRVRPGEISRAHHGVLFLDEFPLFRADVIDALRQPLESGEVTIARGESTATFPAQAMFVLAANPCPCGNYHPQAVANTCVCDEASRRRYRTKLSGPVADRIDIWRDLRPPSADLDNDRFAVRDSSAEIRARVVAARGRQRERYAGRAWRLNSQVPASALGREWPLPPAGRALLEAELRAGRLTRRGMVRVHRVAWSVADLRGGEVSFGDVSAALALRCAQPLPGRAAIRDVERAL